jgi:hypothetical protein
MIDPGLIGSIAPIVLGAGVGLAVRRALANADNRHGAPVETPPHIVTPRPRVRPAAPAARAATAARR